MAIRHLIVNPAARGGASTEGRAVAAFARLGERAEVHRTSGPGDAARLARTLGEAGVPLFVLGGDGTVMEVVTALAGREIPVGILPGGTGNQLARHLRIPLRIEGAVPRVLAGLPTRMDLGRLADDRRFALSAGAGFDASMIAGASAAAKRRFGVGAYVWSGARALTALRPFPVRAVVDGRVIEREVALAMIANVGALMDGRLRLGPGVDPQDGALDLILLSPRGLADGLSLALRMLRGRFREGGLASYHRGSEITLMVEGATAMQADGELLPIAPLHARVDPLAALFLGPA